MRLALALRTVAVLIAVAALADPVITMGRSVRQPLTIAIIDTPTLALPDAGGTRGARAHRIADELLGQLSDIFAVTVRYHPQEADADPCPADAACVVISDGVKPRGLQPRDRTLGSIRVGSPLTPNVAIDAVESPHHTSRAARAALLVHLSSIGVGGRATALRVFDGNTLVGNASYTWPQVSAATPSTATVRVEWAPIEAALRHIRVVASDSGGEATLLDNERHLSIDVIDQSGVVFYEPQPTWNGTFVRRVLESDRRFVIASRSRVASSIGVGRADVRLDARTLFGAKASAVVVTSPQLLTAVEVDALDRFARLRGGSVIVLLDSHPTGPIERLLPRVVGQRREPKPVHIGDLSATEIVVLDPGLAGTTIAGIGNEAVVVSAALGHGRVVVSGALDAWRYRIEGERFSSFWRALMTDAITAAGDPLIVTLSTTAARPGQYVDVEIEARSPVPMPPVYEATARLSCASESTPVRLWPVGPKRFAGRVIAGPPGQCRVYASVTTLDEASAPLSIDEAAGSRPSHRDDLSHAVLAYGGFPVAAGNEDLLVTRFRELATATRVPTPVHPMRSPLWIVPFALGLSAEWWLRRRRGRA